MSDAIDWVLLTRCLRGVASTDERAAFEAWCLTHPADSDLVEAVRRVMRQPEMLTEGFDSASARERMARSLEALESTHKRETPALRLVVVPARARRGVWIGVGVLVAAAVTAVMVRAPSWRPAPAGVAGYASVATVRGQLARVQLDDGTQVTLGAESRLRYARRFGTGGREVELEGEGYFDVVHDAKRPFRVHARNAVAEDLGTEFVVRAYPEDAQVRVVVASGRVALGMSRQASAVARQELGAGQLGRLGSDGAVSVESVDPHVYVAWTQGRLVFDRTPVPEVVARLARWYDVRFELTDSSLALRHFTGAFDGASLADVLEAIGPPLHMRAERRGGVVVLTTRQ